MAATKLEHGLNDAQLAAVRHVNGPLLVLAGAGSGKTRVVTRRIAALIANNHAAPDAVLAVTFTNKAAGEMRERVAALVGPARAREVVVSTFHAFCLAVLREHIEHIGYRKSFTISSERDKIAVLRRILENFDGVRESFSPILLGERISLLKGSSSPSGDIDPKQAHRGRNSKSSSDKYEQYTTELFARYQSALRAANTLDFDDLLRMTLQLWDSHPRILRRYQKKFQFVLVDEYQDTNRVQYELIRRLAAPHGNLMVVGDDDQAIYGWRGADLRLILNFERDFRGARTITLDRNYRSRPAIVDAANAVIANNRTRHAKRMVSTLKAARPIDWFITGDEEHEAKVVVERIQHIRTQARAAWPEFAVLYRSNIQSRPLEIACRGAGVPYTVIGGRDTFDRPEVRDVVNYLKALANPRDEASLLRIINVPPRGIGDKTLELIHEKCRNDGIAFEPAITACLREDRVPERATTGLAEVLSILREFRRRFNERGSDLGQTLEDLLKRIDCRGEIGRTSKTVELASLRWDNVQAVVHALRDYHRSSDRPTLHGFLDASALDDDGRRSRNEGQSNAVTLMTMHSAKGLEFPFVFVVGLEDGLLPHEKSLRGAALEEERRLFYVAMTRARRHLTLTLALSRSRNGKIRMSQPSRFLEEIPASLVKKHVRAAEDMLRARIDPSPPKRKRRGRKTARAG